MQAQQLASHFTHTIASQELVLLPQKAIFWKQKRALLLADLHLGKAGHFRKSGIPVPGRVHDQDLLVLQKLIEQWQPLEVIFLGDLFHSSYNSEWEQLESWMTNQKKVRFILIKGNHDILPDALFRDSKLQIIENKMEVYPFLLTHEPPEAGLENKAYYTLCGHIHPAVVLKGTARQQLTLPCFYFGLHWGLLPAFGKFTGFYKIKPKAGEKVYGVLPERVIPLST